MTKPKYDLYQEYCFIDSLAQKRLAQYLEALSKRVRWGGLDERLVKEYCRLRLEKLEETGNGE